MNRLEITKKVKGMSIQNKTVKYAAYSERKTVADPAKAGKNRIRGTWSRIALVCLSLLVMIPAALAYAGGGLLSGFPSSAAVGDSVTWKIDPGGEEGDLKVTATGASVSVSGNSFTVKFHTAGKAVIKASIGDSSDTCTVTVREETSGDSADSAADADGADKSGSDQTGSGEAADTEDQTPDDGGESSSGTGGESVDENGDETGETGDGSSTGEDGQGGDSAADPGQSEAGGQAGRGTGGRSGMPASGSGKLTGATGAMAGAAASASGTGSSGTGTDSKTVYAGAADNYLEVLKVKGYDFSQTFHKTRDTYFLTVSTDVDSIDVTAEPSDSDAEVVITGEDSLSVGRNKVMVSVTAENGAVRVYRIYVDVK